MRRLVSYLLILILPFAGIPPAAGASLGSDIPAADAKVTVVEYYHAGLDHFFVTANDAEKALLDSGTTRGWARTGQQFDAYAPNATGVVASPVCRFYGRPEAGLDSHFYSASSDECGAVAHKFASSWQFESGNVFRIPLPNMSTGDCAAGTLPVYRLFNNRTDANHRYTTESDVRDLMVAAGYIAEGYGPDSVAFCTTDKAVRPAPGPPPLPAPKPPGAPAASIAVAQVSAATFTFTGTATPVGAATIVSRVWDHGDGTSATGSTSTHTYAASGTYAVRYHGHRQRRTVHDSYEVGQCDRFVTDIGCAHRHHFSEPDGLRHVQLQQHRGRGRRSRRRGIRLGLRRRRDRKRRDRIPHLRRSRHVRGQAHGHRYEGTLGIRDPQRDGEQDAGTRPSPQGRPRRPGPASG